MPVPQVSEDIFNQKLGQRIRDARIQAALTQQDLGLIVGLSRGSIANIERGEQAPPPYRLAHLAEALRTQLADLVPSLTSESGAPHVDRHLPPAHAEAVARVRAAAARKRNVSHG